MNGSKLEYEKIMHELSRLKPKLKILQDSEKFDQAKKVEKKIAALQAKIAKLTITK